jgi:hypothetical protein
MPRFHFVLVEEPVGLVPRARPRPRRTPRISPLRREVDRPDPMNALLSAIASLTVRGEGPEAWTLVHDPLAFLLDALGDAVAVWGEEGEALFAIARRRSSSSNRPAPRASNTSASVTHRGCGGAPPSRLAMSGSPSMS